MAELKEIDNNLTIELEKLKSVTDKLAFETVCEFKLHSKIDKGIWEYLFCSGIYLIEIKNNNVYNSFNDWIENFRNIWEDEKYKRMFVPNLKKKRIEGHSELKQWIPIYIGKSKNIGGRIAGHIHGELNKTTFALKLNARENLKEETYRLSIIKVDVKNYDTIVPVIESALRNRLNPIIGKQ